MTFNFVVLAALVAVAQAGLLPAAGTYTTAQLPTITSQSANILRSYGNLGQVSTYSKTIDTPYSSVSKSDVRVSNPGLQTYATAPVVHQGYAAAPLIHQGYAAAPVVHQGYAAAPVVHQGYAASPVAHQGYAAGPVVHQGYAAAPVVHQGYAAAPVVHQGYAAAPVVHQGYATAPVVAKYAAAPAVHGALGVAYSPASAVSHVTYQGVGASYGW